MSEHLRNITVTELQLDDRPESMVFLFSNGVPGQEFCIELLDKIVPDTSGDPEMWVFRKLDLESFEPLEDQAPITLARAELETLLLTVDAEGTHVVE